MSKLSTQYKLAAASIAEESQIYACLAIKRAGGIPIYCSDRATEHFIKIFKPHNSSRDRAWMSRDEGGGGPEQRILSLLLCKEMAETGDLE